jgi:tetratricopeptide (TPR) repeat protein
MNTGKVWCGISVLLAMALSASPARAQSEAQNKQEAKEHYEKATRLYDLARYGDAIGEYEAAYLLVADPNLLYNMGQAYRLWDKPEEAIRCYKNYLRNRADASNRADVEKRIAELERTIEDRHRSGTASSAPSPPPVAAPAPPPVGEPPPVAIEVAAPAATLAQPAGTVSESAPSHLGKPSRVLPYTLLAAGGAGLVTSLVTGLAAANKAKQIADASKQPNHPVFDPSVQSAGKTLNAVAIVAGVTGLAAGGVGLYFYFRTRRASATAASVTSGTQAAFFPLAGPGFAGGGASVDF